MKLVSLGEQARRRFPPPCEGLVWVPCQVGPCPSRSGTPLCVRSSTVRGREPLCALLVHNVEAGWTSIVNIFGKLRVLPFPLPPVSSCPKPDPTGQKQKCGESEHCGPAVRMLAGPQEPGAPTMDGVAKMTGMELCMLMLRGLSGVRDPLAYMPRAWERGPYRGRIFFGSGGDRLGAARGGPDACREAAAEWSFRGGGKAPLVPQPGRFRFFHQVPCRIGESQEEQAEGKPQPGGDIGVPRPNPHVAGPDEEGQGEHFS